MYVENFIDQTLTTSSYHVYTEIVPNATKATLQAIIRGKAAVESVIHTDGWRGYDGLVDLGFDKHFRVNHSKNEFASEHNHVNGIESSGATLSDAYRNSTASLNTPSNCI